MLGRDLSLDALRTIAIFLVVVIHIAAPGFYRFGPDWAAFNTYDGLARPAVPLFFMISGALLLPREHTVLSIARRIWRVLLPLIAWSIVYLSWEHLTGHKTAGWLRAIATGPVSYHLWFLYTLIGAYVFMPILSAFFRNSTIQLRIFSVSFWFLGATAFAFLHVLNKKPAIGFDFAYLSLFPGFMLLGAVLYHDLPRSRLNAVAAAAACVLASGLAVSLTAKWSAAAGRPFENLYLYNSPLVAIASAGGFVAFRYAFKSQILPTPRIRAVVEYLGRKSFGVYLVHVLLLNALAHFPLGLAAWSPWISVPVLSAVILGISVLLVGLLQRAPLLRLTVPD